MDRLHSYFVGHPKLAIGSGLFSLLGAGALYAIATAFQASPSIRQDQIRADGGNVLNLRDKRILEYFVHGDVAGKTVLLALHGAQTTGKLFSLLHDWAKSVGVRIIAPSLPGFGLTQYSANYRLEDWVLDMQELMAQLHIERFHVLGTSLGSIHAAALACLYEPRQSVGNVQLYVAYAPADDADKHDPLQGSVLDMFGRMRRFPLFKRLFEKLLVLPLLRLLLPRDGDVSRSIRYQWEGIASCADVIYQPWRFDWKSMARGRQVIIVSGRKDTAAPPHNQLRLNKQIVGSQLIQYDGEHDRALKEPEMFARHVQLLLRDELKS